MLQCLTPCSFSRTVKKKYLKFQNRIAHFKRRNIFESSLVCLLVALTLPPLKTACSWVLAVTPTLSFPFEGIRRKLGLLNASG